MSPVDTDAIEFEYTVLSDERMEERCRDVHQDQGKEHESKVEVCIPEHRVKSVALRQDRWKMHAAVQYDRIGRRRQHGPADQRHADHQNV